MQYRKDIDGLRAIAVGSVILFHAGFSPQIPGGFFGVDIFFVISGFLIGRILFTDIAEGRYSLLRFYERRARRILPALFFVLLVSYVFARLLLKPLAFSDFRSSLFATLGFASNIYFWLHSSYFERASELKPLLHTWSLGVEEQYYILFPLLAFALRQSRWRWAAIALCAAASFVWAIATVAAHPNAAFYLLPARAWELLLGALGALWVAQNTLPAKARVSLSILGVALILVALLGLNAHLAHPGAYTLIPTLGTVLVLVAQSPGGIATRLLQLPPMVWLGQISYSAYLWHQPLFAFWIYRFGKPSFEHYAIALIALTLLLAYASWRFIENPTRNAARISHKQLAWYSAAAIMLLATALVPQTWLINNRANEALQQLVHIENLYDHFEFQKNIRNQVCHSVSMAERERNGCLHTRSKNMVLFGDSYAASLYQGLRHERDSRHPDYGIIQLTDGNAPPFFQDGQIDGGASLRDINEAKLQAIAALQPQKIVINWMIYGKNSSNDPQKELEALQTTIARLRTVSPVSSIVVIGPAPNWSVSLQKNLIEFISDQAEFPRYMQHGLSANETQWDAYFSSHLQKTGITYLSALDEFCTPAGCLTSVDGTIQGMTAVDWGHLTKAGSLYLAEKIAPHIFE
ncbi:peptidoglycan/LPS O-acetylase OafA/YrhL [Comamonas sp. BIGb0152]|uniref:acyltransferase family protein n=1 Tax=Comamonas sp. BIGb0152 TaxID=2940601 RepID=UPI002169A22F|nr:acyltransferase family protein [Comamonas sp. BIGb0152]MCS4293848.1 peptidoglycan/LPS O-acetylase OafA/YrhL [Comamonas sp. BIGb0152]